MIQVKLCKGIGVNAVKETLNRIGIASERRHELFVSLYLTESPLGGYRIGHFKEYLAEKNCVLFDLCDDDQARLETIVYLLIEWKMIKTDVIVKPNRSIKYKVVQKNDNSWVITHKIKL